MTPDSVFSIAGAVAFGAWALLVVRPRATWVRALTGTWVPVAFAVAYVTILGMRLGSVTGDFNSLNGVAALFSDRWTLLAGWIHYLAFDLWVGTWEANDAHARGIAHWKVVPCLVLTFLVGPAGWLLYMALRAVTGRRIPSA